MTERTLVRNARVLTCRGPLDEVPVDGDVLIEGTRIAAVRAGRIDVDEAAVRVIDVGDRVLHTVRPPIFDSPTTRGLYDPTTGVYWASDAFASPMLTPVRDVAALERGFWADGIAMFGQYVAAWLPLVDDVRY